VDLLNRPRELRLASIHTLTFPHSILSELRVATHLSRCVQAKDSLGSSEHKQVARRVSTVLGVEISRRAEVDSQYLWTLSDSAQPRLRDMADTARAVSLICKNVRHRGVVPTVVSLQLGRPWTMQDDSSTSSLAGSIRSAITPG
jgi:hypothetical protein